MRSAEFPFLILYPFLLLYLQRFKYFAPILEIRCSGRQIVRRRGGGGGGARIDHYICLSTKHSEIRMEAVF